MVLVVRVVVAAVAGLALVVLVVRVAVARVVAVPVVRRAAEAGVRVPTKGDRAESIG